MTRSHTAARWVSTALAIFVLAGPGTLSAQAQAKSVPQSVPRLAFLNESFYFGPELRTVRADGRQERTVAKEATSPVPDLGFDRPWGSPAWSPDGKTIAWGQLTGVPFAVKSELRVAGADGSNDTTLVSVPGIIDEVRWSPDGRRLAFVLRVPNAVVNAVTWTDLGDRRDIYLINKDGSGLRLLAPLHATYAASLDFSPDGTKLAFEGNSRGVSGIYTMGLDGASVPTRLTPLDLMGHYPRWSPDGTRVAFTGSALLDGTTPRLWTVNADGSELRKVGASTWHPPTWSPDGRWLAYMARSGIGTIRVDGSIKRALTSLEDYWPVWSRTGRIAFIREMSNMCCERALWVMDADGSNARRVSAAIDVDFGFAWSR